MAGQLLSKLQSVSTVASTLSHEAKLGMMVITILFFAFCFLVYHKMDLHQRRLTHVSIQPKSEGSENAQSLDTTPRLESDGDQIAATDPLMTDPLMTATEPESSDLSGDLNFSEPAELSKNSAEAHTPTPAFEGLNHFTAEPTANELAVVPSSTEMHATVRTDAEQPVPMPLDALSVTADVASGNADIEFVEPLVSDSAGGFAFNDSSNERITESDSSLAAPDEPVLIAMADPQGDNAFSGGFSAEDSNSGITAGRAPMDESNESVPVFANDSSAQDETEPRTTAALQSTQFGSGGFDAVTQPAGRTNKHSVRTAAGSGADGKFSLAAFNYQNNAVEPAPDDGSTFDSVVVLDGDNYSKISKRIYGTSRYFSALAVFNQHRLAEPKHMRPGMVILTPTKEVLEERYPQLFLESQRKVVQPAAFLLMEDGSPAYRVGERETLSEISQRFLGRSSRWVEILRLNQPNVKDPNKLKPGLILALPADATEVSMSP